MKNLCRAMGALSLLTVPLAVTAQPVALQNATATFSQTLTSDFFASDMINGVLAGIDGWAIFDTTVGLTNPQTAVFETVTNLTAPGLRIDMLNNYGVNPGHNVGRFRFSYTTDDRATFADGLQTGGDVTANWTVMTPASVTQPAGMSSTILGDGSVLMSGSPAPGSYFVNYVLPLSGVTGLRLEVLADASLPGNGPGMFSTNGNFVLTELTVTAIPEPATMSLAALSLLAIRARRRR